MSLVLGDIVNHKENNVEYSTIPVNNSLGLNGFRYKTSSLMFEGIHSYRRFDKTTSTITAFLDKNNESDKQFGETYWHHIFIPILKHCIEKRSRLGLYSLALDNYEDAGFPCPITKQKKFGRLQYDTPWRFKIGLTPETTFVYSGEVIPWDKLENIRFQGSMIIYIKGVYVGNKILYILQYVEKVFVEKIYA